MGNGLCSRMLACLLLSLAIGSTAVAAQHGPDGGARRKFTLAVIPDTQYLFDEDRGNQRVLEKSLQWIVDHTADENIVFTVHLGDIVNNGASQRWGQKELAAASDAFEIFDRNRIQYGVLAGNHDIPGNTFDSERGHTTYLDYFGPQRTSRNRSFCGATPDGYNTCYTFNGGGQQFLLLALDWRASDATIAWARGKLAEYRDVPTIVATHEILANTSDIPNSDAAVLVDYGRTLWDRLIKSNSQIFMTLNGHHWPAGRTVMKNLAGKEVYMHLVNYQDRYFSGSAMLRLYEFDMQANSIDVQTFSPFWLEQPANTLPPIAQGERRLQDAANQFTMQVDFKKRFAADKPVAPSPPVAAARMIIKGTVAYWRFEGPAGQALPDGSVVVKDLSGRGNDLTRVTLQNGKAGDLAWSRDFHPQQPSRGSLYFNGSRPFGGAYLRTADNAPVNAMTFKNGYTVETFLRLPEICCENEHSWMGALTRMGNGADIGRPGDDPLEPLVTLTVSPSREFQWAVAPFSDPELVTNWGFRVPTLTWYHVALVNDGKRTVMYINGSPDQRNPERTSVGLQTSGEFWMIGAKHYARVVEHSFYGWMGDVRIVDRPLPVREFMISR
jgi:hypothetical protein